VAKIVRRRFDFAQDKLLSDRENVNKNLLSPCVVPFCSRFGALIMKCPQPKAILLVFVLLLSAGFSRISAQPPLLPDFLGVTQKGVNLLSWTSQYEKLKSIAVQRSADSFFNYSTIGYVRNLKPGPQAFIDGHPMPGKNWYRLQILFGSDLTWYSNRLKLFVDSAQLAQAAILPPNDSLQKLASRIVFNDTTGTTTTATEKSPSKSGSKAALSVKIPEATGSDAYTYVKSQYVFTNPFTGHVNVEIKDAATSAYSLKFYDQKDNQVLDIPRISEASVIIDRRNFQRKGIFKFELYRNKEKLETGYITIY
jgi:hypothetical protein